MSWDVSLIQPPDRSALIAQFPHDLHEIVRSHFGRFAHLGKATQQSVSVKGSGCESVSIVIHQIDVRSPALFV
jgi:hypothetical protein